MSTRPQDGIFGIGQLGAWEVTEGTEEPEEVIWLGLTRIICGTCDLLPVLAVDTKAPSTGSPLSYLRMCSTA